MIDADMNTTEQQDTAAPNPEAARQLVIDLDQACADLRADLRAAPPARCAADGQRPWGEATSLHRS